MLSFSGERTSWQLFRKQLRSSCDQNGMGWAITVGHAMNQFLIHIAASNAAATAASKKGIPKFGKLRGFRSRGRAGA